MAAMKKIYFLLSIFMLCQSIWGAAIWLKSPNGKIKVNLNSTAEKSWFLSVDYSDGKHFCNLFPSIRLGLKRSDADFNSSLRQLLQLMLLRNMRITQPYMGKRADALMTEMNEV